MTQCTVHREKKQTIQSTISGSRKKLSFNKVQYIDIQFSTFNIQSNYYTKVHALHMLAFSILHCHGKSLKQEKVHISFKCYVKTKNSK